MWQNASRKHISKTNTKEYFLKVSTRIITVNVKVYACWNKRIIILPKFLKRLNKALYINSYKKRLEMHIYSIWDVQLYNLSVPVNF
jgi:hypothetical protein